MNNLLPQSSLLVQSLGWALLQSLWQCLLIYACMRIVLALAGKQSAKLRYVLSMLSLMVMFAWFLDTWTEQWLRLKDVSVMITQAGTDIAPIKTSALPAVHNIVLYDNSGIAQLITVIQPYLPVAVGIYLLGLVFMLTRFGVSIYGVRQLRSKGFAMPADEWQEWLNSKKEQLLVSRPIQLLYSMYAKVPMTIGTLKPVILMPIAMAGSLSTDQLEAILLHELAHIKRNDYLLNILQSVAETMLFFNPFVWLASSIVRREREHCCDDLVLSTTDGPLPYAKALAALETYRQTNSMTMAATGNKNRLFNRIKRIMEMKKQKNNYSTAVIATLVITAMIISIAWFSPTFAQSHKTKAKTTTTTTKTYSDTKITKAPDAADAPEAPEGAESPRAAQAPEAPEGSQSPEVAEAPEAPEPSEAPEAAVAPVPPNWEEQNKELKRANKEIERANKEMANIDWDAINKEMENADREIEKANKEMATVNWDEINKEMANAQKEIAAVDWKAVDKQISDGMEEVRKSITDPKVRKQVEQSLELARKQTQRAMEQSHRAIEQAQRNAERQRSAYSANVSVSGKSAGHGGANTYSYSNGNGYTNGYSYGSGNTHASSSVSLTAAHVKGPVEDMLQKMEKSGLIDRTKAYRVEKYSDRLYINGQLQPQDVYNRYAKYLNGKTLTIKGNRNNITINTKE